MTPPGARAPAPPPRTVRRGGSHPSRGRRPSAPPRQAAAPRRRRDDHRRTVRRDDNQGPARRNRRARRRRGSFDSSWDEWRRSLAPRKPRPKPRARPDAGRRRRSKSRRGRAATTGISETPRAPDACPVRRKPKVAQKATLKLNSKGLTTAGKVAGALGVGVDVVRRALLLSGRSSGDATPTSTATLPS